MSRSRLVAAVLAAVAALAFAALGLRGVEPAGDKGSDGAHLAGDGRAAAQHPNVIVILADDLDTSLLPYVPNVTGLIRDQGASFSNFYVEQSSCCPSRASILSGLYAHNHGVIGNVWPEGGYDRWKQTRQDDDLPVWLDRAGYRSAMLGKYFNEYPYHTPNDFSDARKARLRDFVPPGWQSWASPVQGNAYAQDHYRLNVDGHEDADFHHDYLDSWLGDRMLGLVDGNDGFDFAKGGQFIYYASYSPHTPYAYPKELEGTFADAQYPRTPDFDEADTSDKFGSTRTRKPLTASDEATIDEMFRKRIRSVQTLDQTVGRLVQDLSDQGALDNTYLIFTSDNGYHMGNHRREIGKYTQFQTDVRVPFFVRGPGITPGSTYDDVAGNIDIAPTIAEIAGAAASSDVDGVSLLSRLHGGPPLSRKYYLIGRALTPTNTTTSNGLEEAPETYVENSRSSALNDFTGVTNGRFKLIRYTHIPHEELYDLENDPYELDNLLSQDAASYAAMSPQAQGIVDRLRAELDRLASCAGETCR